MTQQLEKTAAALRTRGFEAEVFACAADAAAYVLDQIAPDAVVAAGGSATVESTGLHTQLRARGNTVLRHWDVEPAERPAILRKALQSDAYLCSANALTEAGVIVQIDGTCNRVAALCYGPKAVFMIVGRNKIVSGGYAQAIARIKREACPKNARRLGLPTPCAATGTCDAANCAHSMCSVTAAFEHPPRGRRFAVLLVDEDLGF